MWSRLVLQKSAYFYKLKSKLTKKSIKNAFTELSSQGNLPVTFEVVKKTMTVNYDKYKVSLLVIQKQSIPSFLTSGAEHELYYAYFLSIEYLDYIVISVKNISGWKTMLAEFIEEIDYSAITRFSLGDSSKYEKFSLVNTDISDTAIRKRSIESKDLKTSYSPYGASRYVLKNLRVRNGEQQVSITSNTSRINNLGGKGALPLFIQWASQIIKQLKVYTEKSTILDNFAIPIDIEQVINNLVPVNCLFMFADLYSSMEKGDVLNASYKGRQINLSKLLMNLDKSCEVKQSAKKNTFEVLNSSIKQIIIRKQKKSFSIQSKKFAEVEFELLGVQTKLLDFVNNNGTFVIGFDNSTSMYFANTLFNDSKLLGNIEGLLSIFITEPFLGSTNLVEKHNGIVDKTFPTDATGFTADSLFNYIESTLDKSDYLVCDDLGDEWADYIGIDKTNGISFYHAKIFKLHLSTTGFHEVVSQALKNIGNMVNVQELPRKEKKWDSVYSNSEITRIRRSPKDKGLKDLLSLYNSLSTFPNVKKTVYLVVDKFTFDGFKTELEELSKGNKAPAQVVQNLWLLSSLVHSCKEAGVNVFIYTAP